MAISENSARAIVTLPKDLKARLEEIAKEQSRSLSGLIVYILKEYVKSK